jgi:thermolysin
MKRLIGLVCCALLFVSFLEGAYVGKVYFKPRTGQALKPVFRVPASFAESHSLGRGSSRDVRGGRAGQVTAAPQQDQLSLLQAYFEAEEKKGNLRLKSVEDDPEARMEHRRYTQYYKDLEVFGGEIIKHFKEGQIVEITGEYYEIEELDTSPILAKDAALRLMEEDLGRSGLTEDAEKTKLIIYPIKDGDFRLAYHIVLTGGADFSMTGIVDAKTGDILLKFSNIKTDELTIGIGTGCHGEAYKFPTTLDEGIYWLMDLKAARPVNQFTYDYRTFDGKYWYVSRDSDNTWDSDGALVSAHTYLGLIYDYYYLTHGLSGMNDKNLDIKATIHWPDGKDNAFWNGQTKMMYFLDPGQGNYQFAGALDVVAHEYSHGVTDHYSGLIYSFESGALNESFSDIMGTAVEFFWQETGSGFLKADWVCGEDARPTFRTSGLRNLSNPNSNSQSGSSKFPDPCHLNQVIKCSYKLDYGGVHLNSTLYSHAYYLLANGGTNKVSKKAVSGIGIDKATKIFFRTWVHYLKNTSDFMDAANMLLTAAHNLYGSGSAEYTQTVKAMEAIGWVVN